MKKPSIPPSLQIPPNLQTLLSKWQGILRLQDWEIVIGYRRIFDMREPGEAGNCQFVVEGKRASIAILDPADYDPATPFPFDVERVVVHELVHLHLAMWNAEGTDLKCLEQAVESLASALVCADRGTCARN